MDCIGLFSKALIKSCILDIKRSSFISIYWRQKVRGEKWFFELLGKVLCYVWLGLGWFSFEIKQTSNLCYE